MIFTIILIVDLMTTCKLTIQQNITQVRIYAPREKREEVLR